MSHPVSSSSVSPIPEIDVLYAEWGEAMRAGNVSAVMSMLTEDYLLVPNGGVPQSRAMLAPRLTAAFLAYEVESTFECEERIVDGALAFERGWDVQRVRPRNGGEEIVQRQRVFLVLRRGSDGKWRFARGMSNAAPAGAPS